MKLKIFNNLQICRGIGAIMIVLAHANLMIDKDLLNGAFVISLGRVDFFFILSGFLIYYVNSTLIGQRQSFRKYIRKRFVRIYPVYWLYTIIFLCTHFLVAAFSGVKIISWFDFDFGNTLKSLILYPTDLTDHKMPIIPVAWTLSCEIVFYLIFALCIITPKKFSLLILTVWLMAILWVIISKIDLGRNYILITLFHPRNIEFLFGVAIAELALQSKLVKSVTTSIILLLTGIALLLVSWVNEMFNLHYFDNIDVLNFGIPHALIIFSVISMEGNKRPGRVKRVLIYLGEASYSIYLTHFIGIIVLNALLHKVTSSNLVVFLTVSLLLVLGGCLAYSLVEKPVLVAINRYIIRGKTKLIATAAVV